MLIISGWGLYYFGQEELLNSTSAVHSVLGIVLASVLGLHTWLASCAWLYDAARVVGDQVRRISDLDRAALQRDKYQFNVNLLLGGQIGDQSPGLYPHGNPLSASED